eukprot:1048077-Prymnesium_polylepis.1
MAAAAWRQQRRHRGGGGSGGPATATTIVARMSRTLSHALPQSAARQPPVAAMFVCPVRTAAGWRTAV